MFPLRPALRAVLERQRERTDELERLRWPHRSLGVLAGFHSEVLGPHRASVESEETTVIEEPIDEGLRQVRTNVLDPALSARPTPRSRFA
jgi:hypothetical protein